MSGKLYVGNLSWNVTSDQLQDLMETVGTVKACGVMMERPGRSKGCALVEYEEPSDAAEAIKQLNDTVLDGRPIFVREDRGPSGPSGGKQVRRNDRKVENKSQSFAPPPSSRVFVGNLSFDATEDDLLDAFNEVGQVVECEILGLRDGRSKGCALVEMATDEGAQRAIQYLTEKEVCGRRIFVREDRGGRNKKAPRQKPVRQQNVVNNGNGEDSSLRAFVGNLSFKCGWQDLKDHCRQAGFNVMYTDVYRQGDGRSKGCGVVEFSTADECEAAIAKLNNSMLHDRAISMCPAEEAVEE